MVVTVVGNFVEVALTVAIVAVVVALWFAMFVGTGLAVAVP